MSELILNEGIYLILLGAALGSFKASTEFDAGKPFCNKLIDILLGTFGGVALACHFGAEWSMWLSALLAVIGGASGAMVLEVLMAMTPNITKKFLNKWLDKI